MFILSSHSLLHFDRNSKINSFRSFTIFLLSPVYISNSIDFFVTRQDDEKKK
jgi:hypothetical protein